MDSDSSVGWGRTPSGYAPSKIRFTKRTASVVTHGTGSSNKKDLSIDGLAARSHPRLSEDSGRCRANPAVDPVTDRRAENIVKLAVGVKARLSIKAITSVGVLSNKESRNRTQARFMLWTLMMDKPLRKKLRDMVTKKRARLWKSTIRKRSLSKNQYATALCCLSDYAQVCDSNPLPTLFEDKVTTGPFAAESDNKVGTSEAGRIEQRVSTTDMCEQLLIQSVEFVMDVWRKLSTTQLWKQQLPDFQSFLMGLLYTCRGTGIKMNGVTIIPRVSMFVTHVPETSCLTQICELQGVRDCRSAAFGRARITDGMNAIRSTLLYEQDKGLGSVSSLAIIVPDALNQSYVKQGSDNPWSVDNHPIWP